MGGGTSCCGLEIRGDRGDIDGRTDGWTDGWMFIRFVFGFRSSRDENWILWIYITSHIYI